MTIGSSEQSFQIRVTGIDGLSFQSRTRQNVKKRIENILYLESPPADAVKLAYVGTKELSADNNLFIGDRSDTLYANSRIGRVQELISSHQPMSVRNQNFLVTQEFNEAESGPIPLYFRHNLSLDIVPESIRLYDQDLNLVSSDKYKLVLEQVYDETTGNPVDPPEYTQYSLYNSLESSYDHDMGEYIVYFVQYTEVVSGVEHVYTELLSNELAYTEATWDDIWSVTLSLKPWARVYLWEPSSLTITLPQSSIFAVRYEETKRISVKNPTAKSDIDPWFPRVVNGSFQTGYGAQAISYDIPEFENQAFNPMSPYKLSPEAPAIKIDKHLIKLAHEELQSGALYSYFYMLIKRDGIVEYAITDDPNLDGADYRDYENQLVLDSNNDPIIWNSSLLLGLDRRSGMAHVSFDLSDDHEIFATYTYREIYYQVTGLNMNPTFDATAQNEVRAIYLVPESTPNGNLGLQTAAIQWVRVTPSGVITGASQDGSEGNENIAVDVELDTADGYALTGALGMHYSWSAQTTTTGGTQEIIDSKSLHVVTAAAFPRSGWIRFYDGTAMRYAKFTSRTDTTLALSSDASEVAYDAGGIFLASGTTIELVNFLDERTTLTGRDREEEDANAPAITDFFPSVYSRYFVLAEMSLNPPHSYKDAVMIDVREAGGGVDPEKYEDAKLLNPQVQWFSGFGRFDGQPYPGDSVVVVKLPVNILQRFTEQQVQEIVAQSVPLGVQPLIRYYGYQPNLRYVGPDTE
jgi:hypothetical protein